MRGNYRRLALAAGAGLLAALPLGAAGEKIDYEAINKIKAQGMQAENSKVMEISSWLTDVHGPRLSGSPNIQKAGDWAVAQLKSWGLQNVALEKWTNQSFTNGWSNDKFYLAAVSPQAFPIPGTPIAWTPGTDGLVRGDVVLVTETTAEDLQEVRRDAQGQVDHDAGRARCRGVLEPARDARDARGAAADGARDGARPRVRCGAPGGRGGRGVPVLPRPRAAAAGGAAPAGSIARRSSRPKVRSARWRRRRAGTAST